MRTARGIRRRQFLAGLAASPILAAPCLAWAQQATRRRVAIISPRIPVADMTESGELGIAAFLLELRRLGLGHGQQVAVEVYSAEGQTERGPDLGRTVVASKPDVIVVAGSSDITRAIAAVNTQIPTLFVVSDALASGLVTNLARPGGTMTGMNNQAGVENEGKRLALLHEAVPGATPVGYLRDHLEWEGVVAGPGLRRVIEHTATRLGVPLVPVLTASPHDEPAYRRALETAVAGGVQALMVGFSGVNTPMTHTIGALCGALRLPGIAALPTFVDGGGLMSYGANRPEIFRRLAGYAVRILNGERPGDLPVQQPERFDFILNLKAAREMGLTLPASILIQATEVRQ
jgi:putative tryptophan/tyrosine transport system substrate-binding protein